MTSVRRNVLTVLSFFVLSSFVSSEVKDYSVQEALRVLQAIDKVQREQLNKDRKTLKKIMITESELNSYIAYRIDTENEEIMRELRFKLYEDNKIEGKILIDLRGQKIPKLLRPQMNFFFRAVLQVENENVRFDIKKLFLEGQSIQPVVLDLIIQIASRINNQEPTGISDWYVLPYGIKDVRTHLERAVFYY